MRSFSSRWCPLYLTRTASTFHKFPVRVYLRILQESFIPSQTKFCVESLWLARFEPTFRIWPRACTPLYECAPNFFFMRYHARICPLSANFEKILRELSVKKRRLWGTDWESSSWTISRLPRHPSKSHINRNTTTKSNTEIYHNCWKSWDRCRR